MKRRNEVSVFVESIAPFHTNILLSVAVVPRFGIKRRNEVSVFEGSIALFVNAYGL